MKNLYEIQGDTTILYCNHKGTMIETLIDTDDLSLLDSYGSWFINAPWGKQVKPYVFGCVPVSNKKVSLSRLLMGFPEGMVVDHINGDTLDNRKCNLRVITQKENVAHVRPPNTPKALQRPRCTEENPVGVIWHKRDKRWIARIKVDGKRIDLGRFKSIEDAIQARKEGEAEYW